MRYNAPTKKTMQAAGLVAVVGILVGLAGSSTGALALVGIALVMVLIGSVTKGL